MTLARSVFLAAAALALSGPSLPAAEPSDKPKESAEVSYYRDVRRIFQQHCQGCHQPAKPQGGYVMTDHADLFKKGVRLISITLDPKRDTPQVLHDYMKLYELDAKTWSFLTGPPDDVHKVIAAWGMWARPAENGQLDHPSRIIPCIFKCRYMEPSL